MILRVNLERGLAFISATGSSRLTVDEAGEYTIIKTSDFEAERESRQRAINRIEDLRDDKRILREGNTRAWAENNVLEARIDDLSQKLHDTEAALKEAMDRLSMSPGVVSD